MDPETQRLTPRAYLPAVYRLLTDASLRRAIGLLGPRRVGKTILIRHLIAALLRIGVAGTRIGYVEVDHPLLHGQSDHVVGDDREGPRSATFERSHMAWNYGCKADIRELDCGSSSPQ